MRQCLTNEIRISVRYFTQLFIEVTEFLPSAALVLIGHAPFGLRGGAGSAECESHEKEFLLYQRIKSPLKQGLPYAAY